MEESLSKDQILEHVVYHVFLPPKLPQQAPTEINSRLINQRLVELVLEAVDRYEKLVSNGDGTWNRMARMLAKLVQDTIIPLGRETLASSMSNMKTDDVLALYISAQNAAIIIRKSCETTTFEIFEAQAPTESVMSIPGKLVRHFPGPAIEVPNATASDLDFIDEIANFLARMNVDVFEDAVSTTQKAGSRVTEVRDVTDPKYISQLFAGILRGFGKEVEPRRVLKRIADEVTWDNAYLPWRRSPIWLIVRIALQTSVEPTEYKHFMVYLHSQLLGRCCKDPFSSDLLAAMRIKMARRLLKVKEFAPQFLVEAAEAASAQAQTLLSNRWSTIQAEVPNFKALKLNLDEAVIQSLPHSREYLNKVLQGRPNLSKSSTFSPNHSKRLDGHPDFAIFTNGGLSGAFNESKHLALFDFEGAVHSRLPTWVDDNINHNSTFACTIVSSCLEQYTSAALSYYKEDVADQSIMMLTIMELWVALDRLATSRHAILLNYSPEIPEYLVEALLLRSGLHLERATMVQTYLRGRHECATRGTIFTSAFTHDSLPVRFFDQSSELFKLKEDIEQEAQRQRNERIGEMNRLNDEHSRLTQLVSQISCTYRTDWYGQPYHNKSNCYKCGQRDKKDNLTINVHEWPLPSGQLDAKATVFELRCPEEINLWRTATFAILYDLGGLTRDNKAEVHCTLADYQGLSQWSSQLRCSNHRITIASTAKSFNRSHYTSKKIPATENDVCLNHALRFMLYDCSKKTWADLPFDGVSFAKYGTFALPANSSYFYLQSSLAGTAHTTNEILANQSDCPQDLNLHEHYAFGTLRSGPRLQWMNILRGLEENILTFSHEETDLLHTQAAWQIGVLSRDNTSRDWHLDLNELDFGSRLVQQANRVLERVQANWLEGMTVRTIVMLTARLLSSTTETSVHREAYKLLSKTRDVTFTWLEQLSLKLRDAVIEAQIFDYQQRVCEMAAICRSTYDVDILHLRELLSNSEDHLALISCSVALYDNQPPNLEKAPHHLQTLLCRDRRLSFKVLPFLIEKIRNNPQLLDNSVTRSWNGYCPGLGGWTELPAPNSRWVTTATANGSTVKSQQVHFNLLEGRLLVDGKPLGRLPRDYVEHPTYARLFNQKILDVIPANLSGMVFTTGTHINGNQVSLCMDNAKELIVQTQRDGATYELIPHSKLAKDFPTFFSSEYHHWINLDTKVVEFRPLANPWVSNEKNWYLQSLSSTTFAMEQATETEIISMINIHGPAFQDLADQISPLESPRYLHVTRLITRNTNTTIIMASLPRMKLSFFVNEDAQLQSFNFRGQVIDENQSTGTMSGLRNQLVLRAKDPMMQSLPQSRSVLIPHGLVNFSPRANHPAITIDRGSRHLVTFYQYKIDTDLGYLANNNANLTSRLFKIYLHALTSHCLPDPLTGRTGTEEALYELGESATTSFEQINQEQARLLKLIGELTPKRVYYPDHLKAMQTTTWASLSPLSQHYAFCTAANSILERARDLHMFNPLKFDLDQYVTKPTEILLQRALNRTQMYYPLDTFNQLLTLMENFGSDQWYESKDHPLSGWTEQCQLASWASDLAHKRWGQPIYLTRDLVSQFEQWDSVHGPAADLKLTYNRDWLNLRLSSSWLSIYNLCRQAQDKANRYRLNVCVAAGAYSGSIPPSLIPVLISFSGNLSFRSLDPPTHTLYELSNKYDPTESQISGIISGACRDLQDTPSANISKGTYESEYDWIQRKTRDYESNISSHRSQLTRIWLDSWPRTPSTPSGTYNSWFNINSCLEQVRSYFDNCSKNTNIRDHLRDIQRALSSGSASLGLDYSSMSSALSKPGSQNAVSACLLNTLSFDRLVNERQQSKLEDVPLEPAIANPSARGQPPNTTRLKDLLAEFYEDPSRPLFQRYGLDLEMSRDDLSRSDTQAPPGQLPPLPVLEENRISYRDYLRKNLQTIKDWLGPTKPLDNVVSTSGIWPRLTPRIILSKLALRARTNILQDRQVEFQKYARSYIEYQRSQRLIGLALDGKNDEFFKELNLANASPEKGGNHPDWLLTQIEGNFSARTVQTQVAHEMITPSSGQSTVLQLNMGEGKSSVIVPIVAAALADSTRLVRVVVLKPLWRQMFDLLVSRLSGLVNRRVYYLPFGRHIQVGEKQATQIQRMYEECMREGGILLVQPEHILSFKLMGIDQLLSSSTPEHVAASRCLRETQQWLSDNARDILDESDEILHVRYQLVYTVGEQQPLEGHPDRWTTTQQALSLVASHINHLKQIYPDSLKYEARDGGQFPFVRIMPESNAAVSELILSIAEDVIQGLLPNLNLSLLPQATRDVALRFLVNRDVSQSESQVIQSTDLSMRGGLLLLRGLLACGIIEFALKNKHYRVDYGLHLTRSLLAVPYQAKDIPSLRAEFGHPDVAVVLTCLSYYNSGLTNAQLDTCFELLYKLDNPNLEYEQWVRRNEDTPSNISQLSGINLKDREQFANELVPTFGRNAAVVDFFLSSVVFPKAAKQFPHKLSTSGWDLAEAKMHVTTGFSGTNDNRYLLPTSIKQSDPVKQSATNALVLNYLLQPENNHYLSIQRADGETCSAKEFLSILVEQDPEIRVLLDVGAQMLELTNSELVKYWLKLRPDIAAAVYFNDKDEMVILPQNGSPISFHSSPFAQQLDKCIVYLDDGHTRGTDLKLPKDTRAAVTLGPKVTKDRLLQGCMRMRKLGFGQSVIFCASPEIDIQIRKAAKLAPENRIDTLDVIRWAMLVTCKDLHHHISHWAQQGVEHNRRAIALQRFAKTESIKDLKRGWMAPESRTIEKMYGVSSPTSGISECFTGTALGISSLKEQLDVLGVRKLEDPSMDEEQEREVSHEIERERQIERPPKSQPASHYVHPDVRRFVQTGSPSISGSSGIISLFTPLEDAGASGREAWSSKLYASLDFCKALAKTNVTRLGEYMRPVNWVLSGPDGTLVALSPYEADQLLPDIRTSAFVRLHVFSPRLIKSMLSFSDLRFYSTPSVTNWQSPDLLLQLQLSLFAGQLYFDDYEQYRAMCGFLGIFIGSEDDRKSAKIQIQSDGFILESDRRKVLVHVPEYSECKFTASPLGAVKELMGYRRKGMEYLRTHLGQMLHARQLTQNDF